MKCKINCLAMTKNYKGEDVREWEITPEGRVWPCCYFANAWDKRSIPNEETKLLQEDKVIMDTFKEDYDWNNLNTYSLEKIINHTLYWTHIFNEGWNSDQPPSICEKECKVITNEATGTQVSQSVLSVNKLRGE